MIWPFFYPILVSFSIQLIIIGDIQYNNFDRNKLTYNTDENGEFRAAYIFTHRLRRKEKRVFYAMLEESNSPLTIEVDGINSETI